MSTFKTVYYTIHSQKLTGRRIRLALLSDLHGVRHGKNNKDLYEAIRVSEADAVLVTGDMIVKNDLASISRAEELLSRLALLMPVFFVQGNHEQAIKEDPHSAETYLDFERELTKKGVCFLHNEQIHMCIGGNNLFLHGMELPLKYYGRNGFGSMLSVRKMKEIVRTPDPDDFNILLVHTPKYGDTYFGWGADLSVCGHYHGGVFRLSPNTGLISPQMELFPKYCCGEFQKDGKHIVVSVGLGEHSMPIRIRADRELVLIDLIPEE